MASALFSVPVAPFKATAKPGNCIGYHYNKNHFRDDLCQSYAANKSGSLKAKAEKSNQSAKPNSVICADCDGNGAVLCSQCKGSGVNSFDLFNGQFKAGDSCWLCGGRKDMLCGNCNGAGFVGGFLSTFDE